MSEQKVKAEGARKAPDIDRLVEKIGKPRTFSGRCMGELRERAGFTLATLRTACKALGWRVTRQYLSALEAGENSAGYDKAWILARLFRCKMEDLGE